MKIEYKNGNILITIPYDGNAEALPLSSTGKFKMVAGTGGFVTVEGSPDPKLRVSMNVISMLSKK